MAYFDPENAESLTQIFANNAAAALYAQGEPAGEPWSTVSEDPDATLTRRYRALGRAAAEAIMPTVDSMFTVTREALMDAARGEVERASDAALDHARARWVDPLVQLCEAHGIDTRSVFSEASRAVVVGDVVEAEVVDAEIVDETETPVAAPAPEPEPASA